MRGTGTKAIKFVKVEPCRFVVPAYKPCCGTSKKDTIYCDCYEEPEKCPYYEKKDSDNKAT